MAMTNVMVESEISPAHPVLPFGGRADPTASAFLDRVSHELRTPLNSVIGFSRFLQSPKAGHHMERDLEMLERIRVNGEQLLEVIDGLLEFSRVQTGPLHIECTRVEIATALEAVVAAARRKAEAKGLSLRIEMPSNVFGLVDHERFASVARRLLDNAIKFTAAGTVTLTLRSRASAASVAAELCVSDTGIGIAPDRINSIFCPYAANKDTARTHGGAGVGLPISRRLCEEMNCRIDVESALNLGSSFTIRFPDWTM